MAGLLHYCMLQCEYVLTLNPVVMSEAANRKPIKPQGHPCLCVGALGMLIIHVFSCLCA